MRLAKLSGLLVVLFGMTGCISSTTLVKVKPDGSGTIVQTTTMNSQMVAQMKQMVAEMAKSMGSTQSSESGDFFSEKEAIANAAKMGEGVKYVSSEKIKTSDAEGIKATYAFTDVTKLRIDEKPSAPGPAGAMAAPQSQSGQTAFRFTKLGTGNSLLTVVIPQKNEAKETSTAKANAPEQSSADVAPEQLAQMKEIFKGMKISMAVEVDGRLVKTNGAYVNGSRVTLLEMDFGQLLSDEGRLRAMSKIKSMEEAREALKDLRGFKIELGPEVTIEFAGK
jgi:hypothetical protein